MADYSDSLIKYRVAMSTANVLYNEGIITEKDYVTIDTIMAEKYGLSLDSIFRNISPKRLDNVFIQS